MGLKIEGECAAREGRRSNQPKLPLSAVFFFRTEGRKNSMEPGTSASWYEPAAKNGETSVR